MEEFVGFPKLARWNREVIVTEKIDGTNAQVLVTTDDEVIAGSKNRYLTEKEDNFGFAKWVKANEEELRVGLGPGRHFGEWWGSGIQRGYGLQDGMRFFSLFNVVRWAGKQPSCCSVVPELWRGSMHQLCINELLYDLRQGGSVAMPGYQKPEGIVLYHTAANQAFKVTLDGDESPKSQVNQ